MRTSVLFLAHDRLELMEKTLPRMIRCAGAPFRLVIWDNHSSEPVRDLYESQDLLCREHDVDLVTHYSPENLPISVVFNKYARDNPTELLGQMGNDILLTENWLGACVNAIDRVPTLGTVGGYHFDFSKRVEDGKKFFGRARDYNGVSLVTSPHLGGLYVFRRKLWQLHGPVPEWPRHARRGLGFFLGSTGFQRALTKAGFKCAYLADHYWEHLHHFAGHDEYVRRVKQDPKGPPL